MTLQRRKVLSADVDEGDIEPAMPFDRCNLAQLISLVGDGENTLDELLAWPEMTLSLATPVSVPS